jgi:hypothetical protein
MSDIGFVVKVRDAAQMIADAANEYLENRAPKEEIAADFEKLAWLDKKGEKGPFQQTSKQNNSNNDLWQTLQKKVKEHNGFWVHGDFKFWFHQQDQDVIDRRKK